MAIMSTLRYGDLPTGGSNQIGTVLRAPKTAELIATHLRRQIVQFLDSVKGPDKLIEKFRITRFEQDKLQKDRVWLDIRLTPYFPAKSFVIKLDGHKGDDGNEWNSEYEQE